MHIYAHIIIYMHIFYMHIYVHIIIIYMHIFDMTRVYCFQVLSAQLNKTVLKAIIIIFDLHDN